MLAARIRLRNYLLACLAVGSISVCAVSGNAQSLSESPHSPDSTLAAPHEKYACGCADGRRFSVGASLFGKSSTRVVITGFSPEPADTRGPDLPECTDLLVLGQAVRLVHAEGMHPFVKREDVKRGLIESICSTKIRFIEAKKSYDFFADDGEALTLSDEDVAQGQVPADSKTTDASSEEQESELDQDEDLTGKNLLQRMAVRDIAGNPRDAAFNEEDLKEGAYLILRRRVKAPVVTDAAGGMTQAKSPREIDVPAGTLGRIDKRAGFRSEPLWTVDILPNSAPRPFWRSLLAIPKSFGPRLPITQRKVVLASSDVVEINHFLDQYGVEWTHFGERPGEIENAGTTRLPAVYAPPELPLEENVAIALKAGIFEAIQEAALGLVLVFKNRESLSGNRMLVLDELPANDTQREAVPHLLHRQCFVGLDKLNSSWHGIVSGSTAPALRVTGVDVKVFQPKNSAQVPPSYYAIDLELLLRPNFGSAEMPLVCRFPSFPISLGLIDVAERILSRQFEIQRPNAR
ncbi:MAG TPA: hypothetical protein VK638_38900 [Edaphobacter sp.]|nr:hypothetical protein [Edaphobacter sp.]